MKEIISQLFQSEHIDKIINNFTKGDKHTEDLKSELFLILLEYDEEAFMKAHTEGWLNFLIIKIVQNQYRSKTSPFYKNHRKLKNLEYKDDFYIQEEEDTVEDTETLNDIYKEVEELEFVDREIFKMYYKIAEYNPVDGEKRDRACSKPKSSLRKIAANLKISATGKELTVSTYYSHKSIHRSLAILKTKCKDKRV